MTFTARARRLAALTLAASLLLALGACGQAAATYSVDRSPETSVETSAAPSDGKNAEPSDTPRDSSEPSEEPEVSASPEASEPSEEGSPDPDETPSPDAADPEIEEPASAEPSPEAGADEEPDPTAEAPSGTDTLPEATTPSGVLYVLNTNTMKFHLPDCSSVGKMKAKNRLDSSESREAIIAKGYSPCKNCNP